MLFFTTHKLKKKKETSNNIVTAFDSKNILSHPKPRLSSADVRSKAGILLLINLFYCCSHNLIVRLFV